MYEETIKRLRAIEHRATRYLARRASDEKAIDPVDFEFILDEPERADEVLEFTRWLERR